MKNARVRSSDFQAAASPYPGLAREILRELVEIRTTQSGVGSTPAAEAVARRLLAAGYPAADIHVAGPSPRKRNLVARLRGRTKAKPTLLFAHLDVVEARKEDWSPDLDPFRLIEREGYFYGRGTQDVKQCAAILVTNFIRWKQEGWVPERDLILALTEDEEDRDEDGMKWRVSDLTRAQYAAMAQLETGQTAADRKAVAEKGDAAAAVARLSKEPYYNALLRTTSVPTILEGGHAANALPQTAKAVVDCRLLPGQSKADVLQAIVRAIGV